MRKKNKKFWNRCWQILGWMLTLLIVMGGLYVQTIMCQQTNELQNNQCSQHISIQPDQQTQALYPAATRLKNTPESKIRMQLNKQPPNKWENTSESKMKSYWDQQPSAPMAPTRTDGSKEKRHKGSNNLEAENTTKLQELGYTKQNQSMSSSDIRNI